jgi:glycosyltransferase involved in cell wall biosynthesis
MRILFLTQYFPPETGASQNRLFDLAQRLSSLGHSVTVLTALPNYPRGEFYPGYRRKLGMIEKESGLRVIRTWVYTTKRKDFFSRLLNYLSFSFLSLLVGLFLGRTDVIYVDSPPLFLAATGYVLGKVKRAEFAMNVADLWPDSAVTLGVLRNPRLIYWATRLEEGLYRRAALITGQTRGIVSSIQARCPETPVELLTNGVAPEFYSQVEAAKVARDNTRDLFGFNDSFVVAYTGVHGLAQGLQTVLLAAEILEKHTDILFVLFGDGPEKCRLQMKARAKELRNVLFLPAQETWRMPAILKAVDISIVPLRRAELFKGALPSKLFEALAAGTPVVGSVEGEARILIEEAEGGLVVEPENPQAMAEAILRLYHDPTLRSTLSDRGRNYILKNYNRRTIGEKLERLLRSIVRENPSSAPDRQAASASRFAIRGSWVHWRDSTQEQATELGVGDSENYHPKKNNE